MSSQPPRRRRSSAEDDDRGGLPMVPIFAGVIIAGLGIGALLSALAARRTPPPLATSTPIVVTHTPTPIVQRTLAALTPPPRPVPRLTKRATATPHPAPSTPPPTVSPSATARPTPRPSPRPRVRTPAAPSPVRTVAAETVRPAAPIRPALTIKPVPTPRVAQVTPVPPTIEPALAYAQTLVRRYLDAVAHGDDSAAYTALGGSAGNRLSEMQFLDPTMRITSMTAARVAGGGTRVQVEVMTAKGQYFGTYTVDSNGSAITDHQMIPVGGTTSR